MSVAGAALAAQVATTGGRLWIIGGGQPSFAFDAVFREGHTSKLTITDNPLETGVVVSDHAYMERARLEIEAGIGDVWLRMRPAQNPNDPIAPAARDFAWLAPAAGSQSNEGRAATAYRLMLALQASAEPFSVQTGLRLYTNMLIDTISVEQDKETAGALFFRASLVEVLIVNTQTVTYPPRAEGKTARQAAKATTAGEKKTDQVTDAAKGQTIAKSLAGSDFSLDSIKRAFTGFVGLEP